MDKFADALPIVNSQVKPAENLDCLELLRSSDFVPKPHEPQGLPAVIAFDNIEDRISHLSTRTRLSTIDGPDLKKIIEEVDKEYESAIANADMRMSRVQPRDLNEYRSHVEADMRAFQKLEDSMSPQELSEISSLTLKFLDMSNGLVTSTDGSNETFKSSIIAQLNQEHPGYGDAIARLSEDGHNPIMTAYMASSMEISIAEADHNFVHRQFENLHADAHHLDARPN